MSLFSRYLRCTLLQATEETTCEVEEIQSFYLINQTLCNEIDETGGDIRSPEINPDQ